MKEDERTESHDPAFVSTLISEAYQRIQPNLHRTRLIRDEKYSLWLKCENEQNTGSFKWRGALAKLSTFEPGLTIVTASTGNHGLGVAHAARLFDLHAKVFVPSTAVPKKIEKLKQTGAEVITVDGDSLVAELTGKEFASKNDFEWVSPYNDLDVISGQGTIGYEIEEDAGVIDKVFITVGGGGLISGIASWLKHHQPGIQIIGCQPGNSPEMWVSVIKGHVVDIPDANPTLSDGSAGPLEHDSITFPMCQKLVDMWVLITEDEIEHAIRYLYQAHDLIVEGAAGVAMAAAMKEEHTGNSIVILCGGNIDPAVHLHICGK
ncbi:MAG: pyridoxal-phosphate dependent enzyme [Saprospiraceae bacterium]